MKRISKVYTLLATVLVAIILISGCGKEEKAEEITLNIVWAEWDPADYLYELSRDYTEATGIKIAVDKIPWPQFATKVFTAFAARDAAYDIVIGDSQWLGRGATQGHYVDLTDWMKNNGIDACSLSSKASKSSKVETNFFNVLDRSLAVNGSFDFVGEYLSCTTLI